MGNVLEGVNQEKRLEQLRQRHRGAFASAIQHYNAQQAASEAVELRDVIYGPDVQAWPGLVLCARKRPLFAHEKARGAFDVVNSSNNSLTLHDARVGQQGELSLQHRRFSFDHVFGPQVEEKALYSMALRPLLHNAIERGATNTLMAFGQTGSGKTHTTRNLLSHLSAELIRLLQQQHQQQQLQPIATPVAAVLSVFEISGKRVVDLLSETRTELRVLEAAHGEVYLPGSRQVALSSPEQLCALLEQAHAARATDSTAVHGASSRSHALFRFSFQRVTTTTTTTTTTATTRMPPIASEPLCSDYGSLTIVDLAGSEWHANQTGHHTASLRREAAEINASLSVLKTCLRSQRQAAATQVAMNAARQVAIHDESATQVAVDDAAAAKHVAPDAKSTPVQSRHVPWRESPLTRVLKTALAGDALKTDNVHTLLLATVSPASYDSAHSLSTLSHTCREEQETRESKLGTGLAATPSPAVATSRAKRKSQMSEAIVNVTLARAFAAYKSPDTGRVCLASWRRLVAEAGLARSAPHQESTSEATWARRQDQQLQRVFAAACETSPSPFLPHHHQQQQAEAGLDFKAFRKALTHLSRQSTGCQQAAAEIAAGSAAAPPPPPPSSSSSSSSSPSAVSAVAARTGLFYPFGKSMVRLKGHLDHLDRQLEDFVGQDLARDSNLTGPVTIINHPQSIDS
eukprot:g13985.t1